MNHILKKKCYNYFLIRKTKMEQNDNPPSLLQELFYMYNMYIADPSTIRRTQSHSGVL